MYEFSDKEIRNKFKNTEYGKKLNKILIVSIFISCALFVASCIMFFSMGAGSELLSPKEDLWLNILFGITAISIIGSCYFDGKRDGAINQYKLNVKK